LVSPARLTLGPWSPALRWSVRSLRWVIVGAPVAVVLVLGQQVPGEHGELARGRAQRDLRAAPRREPGVKRPQRTGGADRRVRGVDEQATRVRLAGARDVPVAGGLLARLADARAQAEVADQMARAGEAGNVTDHRHQRQRG
jgi:hypothetical protein